MIPIRASLGDFKFEASDSRAPAFYMAPLGVAQRAASQRGLRGGDPEPIFREEWARNLGVREYGARGLESPQAAADVGGNSAASSASSSRHNGGRPARFAMFASIASCARSS